MYEWISRSWPRLKGQPAVCQGEQFAAGPVEQAQHAALRFDAARVGAHHRQQATQVVHLPAITPRPSIVACNLVLSERTWRAALCTAIRGDGLIK